MKWLRTVCNDASSVRACLVRPWETSEVTEIVAQDTREGYLARENASKLPLTEQNNKQKREQVIKV